MNSKWLSSSAMIAVILLIFWGGARLTVPQRNQSLLETDGFISYVIPKLKTFVPKFSLWDRKFVDRRKLAPKKPDANNSPKTAKATGTPTPTASPKPKVAAAATPTPAPKAESDKLKVTVNPVSPKEDFDPAASNPYGGNLDNGGPTPSETPSPETQIGEWKMKLLRSPTKTTMNEFVFEFQTGKLTKLVFYQVIEELMRDSSPEIQKLAVYGLAATPSYDSLVILLTNKDQLSSQVQPSVKATLEAYGKPDKVSIIAMSLRSETSQVVLGSMPLVVKMSQKIQLWSSDQSSNVDDRDRRGQPTRIPKKGFVEILEILRDLENSRDRQISIAAQNTLNQLTHDSPIARGRD